MKKLLLLSALLPVMAAAAEVKDTTFVVDGKSIVVDVQGEKTNVKVFGQNGNAETKISEMNFVDGQEVETVYVGSPFIPTEKLQHNDFYPRFPTAWIGVANITDCIFGSSRMSHSRYSKSFELGITPYYMSVPLNKSNVFGVSAAAQLVWDHLCFQKGYAVAEADGRWGFTPLEQRATGNNINYLAVRIPVLFTVESSDFYIGIGVSPEFRTSAWYRRKGDGATFTDTYGMNHVGLNMTLNWGVGPIVFSGSFGLTPLFKTVDGKKAYQNSASVGVDVLALMKLINYRKDRKKK